METPDPGKDPVETGAEAGVPGSADTAGGQGAGLGQVGPSSLRREPAPRFWNCGLQNWEKSVSLF